MAIKNKIIVNPKAPVTIKFLQTSRETNGSLLEMEACYGPQSKEPPAHYHPYQAEEFLVVKGALSIRLRGEVITLKAGASCHVPKNTVHSMWNHTSSETTVLWKVQPALHTEYLLETLAGLATDNKTNSIGVPNILQVTLLSRKYAREYRLASPPHFIQKLLFHLLTPLARLLGYKAMYLDYLD